MLGAPIILLLTINRTEKVGLAKDWWDMSRETAWYRGEYPEGLQIGEPFPNSQVKNLFNHKYAQ